MRFRTLKKYVSYLLLVPILIFTAQTLVNKGVVKVQDISCSTQYGPCSFEEEEKLDEFLGENIFTLSASQVKERFREDFTIRQVLVEKRFPGRLRVVLEKRKPLVALRPESLTQDGVFLVDRDGVISDFARQSPLPHLTAAGDFVVGKKVDDKFLQAVTLLSLTFKTQQSTLGEVKGDFMKVEVGETEVRYPLERDPKVSVGALQLIMTRSRIDGKLPKTIDLRYSNPVLTY